jgi:putative ABC transport system substrate-binding protein
MRRREFICLLGAAITMLPYVAHSQQKIPTIGILGTPTAATWATWMAAFVQRLRELGWEDGRSIKIEYRWAEGRTERFPEIMAELVRLKVDLVVTSGAALLVAKNATSTIPIVFPLASDPLASGVVASLARPGGNITGLSLQTSDLAGKRLGLLREVVPGFRRLAMLADIGFRDSIVEMGEVEAAARTLGIDIVKLEVRRAEEIAPAFEAHKNQAEALYVCTGPMMNTNRVSLSTLANSARLPTMHSQRSYVEAGGLMSYGPNIVHMFRRSAEYVDKILRGASPGDLPVEQPSQFNLIINLVTAKALGLTIPPTLLARVDEIIE